MAVVCIKIGENEPESYVRCNQLHKHLDIVDVLADGIDPGRKVEEYYLIIYVDTSGMSSQEYNEWRDKLLEPVIEYFGERSCNECDYVFYDPEHEVDLCPQCNSADIDSIQQTAHRRRYWFDTAVAEFISVATCGRIKAEANKRRTIKPSVYRFVANYKATNGVDPSREAVAAYQASIEKSVSMKSISSNDVIPKIEFDNAIRNKITQTLMGNENQYG